MDKRIRATARSGGTRLTFLAVGVAVATAACGGAGSTAQLQSAPGGERQGAASAQPAAPNNVAPATGAGSEGQSAQAPAPVAPGTSLGASGGAPAANPAVPGVKKGTSGAPLPPTIPAPGTSPTQNFASDVGVTKDTINLGNISMQSATRSLGPALAGPTLKTSDALIKYINDNGGVAGRKLNLIYCDDGGDVTRARACYQKLKTQVFAFVPSETWLTQTIHQQLDQDKVPYLSWGWFASEYQDPYMFPCHPNGLRESLLTSKWVVDNIHPKTAAIMYLNDPEDIAARDQASQYLEAHGVHVVASVPQEWDSPDESQHVLSVRVANPDVVMVFTWPTPLAKFLHDAAGQNWAPPKGYWAKHVMGDPGYGQIWGDYAKEKLASLAGFEVPGAVGQEQLGTDSHWGLQQWRMLTAKYTGYDEAGFHFEFAMGHHITQAALSCLNAAASSFRAIGADLTRPKFIDYLETHSFDTGMGVTLKWPHGDHGQQPYSFNHEYMYLYAGAPNGGGDAGWEIKRLLPDPVIMGDGTIPQGQAPPYCRC